MPLESLLWIALFTLFILSILLTLSCTEKKPSFQNDGAPSNSNGRSESGRFYWKYPCALIAFLVGFALPDGFCRSAASLFKENTLEKIVFCCRKEVNAPGSSSVRKRHLQDWSQHLRKPFVAHRMSIHVKSDTFVRQLTSS